MMVRRKQHIINGLRDGIPIAMGYVAVTFSLGIIAARAGLTAPLGFLSSFFTRASAGEYGTYTLVAVQAAYVEVIAMCLVANLRYMLMSAALSQKIAPGTSWFHRILMACCVTDEVFRQKGWDDSHFQTLVFEGHSHKETDWAKRLDKPLYFLLRK